MSNVETRPRTEPEAPEAAPEMFGAASETFGGELKKNGTGEFSYLDGHPKCQYKRGCPPSGQTRNDPRQDGYK